MAMPRSGKSSSTHIPSESRNMPKQPQNSERRSEASEGPGVSELAASLSSNVADAAVTATRAAREQAVELAESVGEELTKVAEDKKQHGAEAMQVFAGALERVASDLEGQTPRFSQYAREAAEKINVLSDNIGRRDIAELSRAATELARSNPVMFFGASVAAGFALSRFLKSSSSHEPRRAGGSSLVVHG